MIGGGRERGREGRKEGSQPVWMEGERVSVSECPVQCAYMAVGLFTSRSL